jgi:hypothetical protein
MAGPPGQYAQGSVCGQGYGFVIAATTVTPEIVRVVFLLRRVNSLRFSSAFSKRIISEFEGTFCRRYLMAACFLRKLKS